MRAIGLIEVRPFDGTDGHVSLRFQNSSGSVFDLPISDGQIELIINELQKDEHFPVPDEEEDIEDFEEPSTLTTSYEAAQERVDPSFLMGSSYDEYSEDDAL